MCHPPNEISDNLVVQSICKRKSPRQLINNTNILSFLSLFKQTVAPATAVAYARHRVSLPAAASLMYGSKPQSQW